MHKTVERPRNRGMLIKLYTLLMITALCILCAGAGTAAFAEPASTAETATQETKSQKVVWKEKKNYFYCTVNKKRQKGLQTIDGKTYLFDNKGRQQTGWRKVGNKTYFFEIKNGQAGCMVTGQTVNGIKLGKDGVAKVTGSNSRKASLLVRFQKLADSLVKPGMKKKEKLKTVFLYCRGFRYVGIQDPDDEGDWDVFLGEWFLDKGYGDCQVRAAGFAYLANAVGYKDVTLRKYDHMSVEIGNRFYDPRIGNPKGDSDPLEYFGGTRRTMRSHYHHQKINDPYRVI